MLNDVRAFVEPGGISFAWPVVLLSLLGLPALVAGYLALQRRRRRDAARFASPDLLPGLLPRRPGWRRHVAPAALLLALAALLVGAARPQREVERDIRQATVVLAIDSSNSMMAEDVAPNRLEAAKAAARTLVGALPPNGQVGIVSFARTATTLNQPTGDAAVIEASLGALTISGGTAVGDAIVESLGTLEAAAGASDGTAETAGAVILLTDGANTEGTVEPLAAARQARDAGVRVHTVSLGTPAGTFVSPNTGAVTAAPPDPAALAEIAAAAGGSAHTATDLDQLVRVYDEIGRQIGTERDTEDISVAFVGAGGLLALLGSALGLLWFRSVG